LFECTESDNAANELQTFVVDESFAYRKQTGPSALTRNTLVVLAFFCTQPLLDEVIDFDSFLARLHFASSCAG